MKLKDKVAIITGGAQGIGFAIAKRFVQEGAEVVIADRSGDPADICRQLAHGTGQNVVAQFFRTDVTYGNDVRFLIDAVIQKYGRIDILVNNAGIVADAKLVDMTLEQFDRIVGVNLRGPFLMTKAVLPHMIAQKYGVILNASSVVSGGNYGQTAYAATKAGVNAFTRTWARELAQFGIRVNAVAPGYIETPMTAPLPDKVKERVTAQTPMRRLGVADEVANLYAFLASDEAAFITGSVYNVDGGIVI